VLNNCEKRIYGIVCLRIGFCPKCVICKCVEEFRVCCQSSNEKAFEEFSQGVIEIYASVGCWVCFVLVVSFVYGL